MSFGRVSSVRRAFLSLAMVVAVCVRGTIAQEDPHEYQAKARFPAITPEFVEFQAPKTGRN